MSLEFSPDPRQESEARLTALLLGEITGAEAASLLETIEADPQLAALYERLKKTVVLVREVSANPAQPLASPGANPATPLKLSEERRQKLLAQFKTVKPKEFARAEKRSWIPSWVAPVGIAAAIVLLLSTLAVPNFVRSRLESRQAAIINKLRQLEGAKQTWAMENHASPDVVPTFAEIQPYMGRGGQTDPQTSIAGEKYILGPVGKSPVAVAKGKIYSLDDQGQSPEAQMVLAAKNRPAPDVKIRAKFIDVTPTAAPAAPAPQQLAQNNRQQIYLPPSDNNGATLPVTPPEHFGNNAKKVTMADGSVQQFSTSALRSGASGGGTSNNVLLFPLDDAGRKDGAVQQFGISGSIGGGGAGNATMPFATNANNFTFYRDINGNGANAAKPEQASGFDNSSQLYASTNGVIGNNAYAGDPGWIGVLNSPQARPSSNGFIGGYAFNTLPPGSNADLDSIHNQVLHGNNFSDASIAAAQNNNVTLSFNTQPTPVVPQRDAIVVLRPPPNTSLADQLSEPQVVTESGRVSTAATLGISEAKPAGLQNQGVGQAEAPLPGETPSLGTLFGNTAASQAAADESLARRLQERRLAEGSRGTESATASLQHVEKARKTTPTQHGAELLTQHTQSASDGNQALGFQWYLGIEAAATPPSALPAAPPLATASVPGQSAQAGDGGQSVPSGGLVSNEALLQDGKLLFEAGKLDEAEAKLKEAYKENPSSVSVYLYLQAIQQKRISEASRQSELASDKPLQQVEKAWTGSQPASNAQLSLDGAVTPSAQSNYGADNGKAPASQFDTFVSTNFTPAPGQAAIQTEPGKQTLVTIADDATRKQIQEKIKKLNSIVSNAASPTNPETYNVNVVGYINVPVQTNVVIKYANPSDIQDALKTLGSTSSNSGSSASSQKLAALYDTKKQELEQLQKSREVLALRAFQQGVETKTPKTASTDIIELAEAQPAKNPSFGARVGQAFTGTVERRAVIKLDRDATDVAGVSGRDKYAEVYDPYFTQTQFEAMQSEKMLDKVIDKLNLRQTWSEQNGGNELTHDQARALLKKNLDLKVEKNTGLVDIGVKAKTPEEAARIANTIAETYRDFRKDKQKQQALSGVQQDEKQMAELDLQIREKETQMASLDKRMRSVESVGQTEQKAAAPDINDAPLPKPVVPAPVPQPEVFTSTNAFSTFSLNIADVSFKLAAASLEKGVMPDPASIRSEEFINAFDYRDPEAPAGVPIAFAWERAPYPFAQNRDMLRFSLKTAATGRAPGRPLNIVLLLDNSGSMERADRVQIIHEALRVLAGQLQPQDTLSIVTFARTARLFVDGVPGNQAANVVEEVSGLTPQGGTNLEDAMRLAYETALRHYLANGINRVVLMTDGAANLGNVDPTSLKKSVEAHRKQGIALDCFGIGWEGYNDDLLEVLARNGDGRYGFLNSPEEAANGFAHQLAGALNVAAEDVKVQVEFNPRRVTVYRQIGYAKLQLTKEQFRDNTVAAAQVGAAEAGNALYTLQVDPNGDGPLATVRVRYKVPGTQDFEEHEWSVPFTGNALSLEQSSPAMRLAASASAFSEWLANSPYAAEVTPDTLLQDLAGVPATFAPDERPQKLVEMIREAKSLTGK